MTRKAGGRFALEPMQDEKDAFSSHAMLGLKIKQKVYIILVHI